MISTIDKIKRAAQRDLGSFLRALYGSEPSKQHDLYVMGDVHGKGGESLKVFPDGGFKDFATGEQGDCIDLAQAHWKCSSATLYSRLNEMLGIQENFRKPHPVDLQDDSLETVDVDHQLDQLSHKSDEFFTKAQTRIEGAPPAVLVNYQQPLTAVVPKDELPQWRPAPDGDPWTANLLKGSSKAPSMVWPYHTKEGDICFWVARFDGPTGKKFSVAYYSDEGWVAKKPRMESYPLLDIHHFWRVKDQDGDTVIVLVEGEKAAVAGNSLGLDGFWFTTWHGGAQGTKKQDFYSLDGRRILFWPDNDAPGKEAMQGIFAVLNGRSLGHLLDIPADWALKDDIADIADRFGKDYVYAFLIDGMTKMPVSLEASIPEDHREPNQLGCVYRLIDRYGVDLKASMERTGEDRWYIYKDGWWQKDLGGSTVFQYATKTVERIWQDCVANDAKKVEHYSNAAKNTKHIKGIVEGAAMMEGVAISENDFDPSPDHLAVANGMLDLRTLEVRPLRRDDMVSKMVPFRYNPKAEAPMFREFLHQITMGDKTLQDFLQIYFGYGLTGLPPDRIFAIFHGSGKNGKSTLIAIIAAIMGDYHVAARVETIMASDRPDKIGEDIIPLRGARLATLQESEKSMKLNEAKIKGLTGRDRMRARYLHSNSWLEWTNTAKLILSTNYRPKISGNDRGIWDRIALVPFDYRVRSGEDDTDLMVKILHAEAEGVLRWMVEGAARYYKNGKKLQRPQAVIARTASYHEDENTIGTFVEDCLVFDPRYRIGATQLYLLYKAWMDLQGDDAVKGTRAFREEILPLFEDLQVDRQRSSDGFFYKGVGKKDDFNPNGGNEKPEYEPRRHPMTKEEKYKREIDMSPSNNVLF